MGARSRVFWPLSAAKKGYLRGGGNLRGGGGKVSTVTWFSKGKIKTRGEGTKGK